MLTIKKWSFKSRYEEKCIREIDFNENVNSIKKILDYLGLTVQNTAIKLNDEEKHMCIERNTNQLNQDYNVSDGDTIELFILPASAEFYEPTLLCLNEDGEPHTFSDVREYNKTYFNFPDIVLSKKTWGNKETHKQRSDMAVDNLKSSSGLIEKIGDNQYRITNKGCRFLENLNDISSQRLNEYMFQDEYQDKQRNLIFFGAPGTGKSYSLNKRVEEIIGENNSNLYERVTFHPDYSYSNFVGTYKPVSEKDENGNDIITYKFVPGPFLRILKKAIYSKNGSSPEPYFLIIEEINRANFASVFGDVFQLLDRNGDGESEYFIDTSEEMREYLKDTSGMFVEDDGLKVEFDDFKKIRIPSNMFIWATMNSADQGVFYMDTAFKRRWDFEHIDINPEGLNDAEFNLPNRENRISWNNLRKEINSFLLNEFDLNEDKLIGYYFISNIENLDDEGFKNAFKNKVIMYLFEDAAKSRRDTLFENCEEKTYSGICDKFDQEGINIFNDKLIRKINGAHDSN